MNAPADKQRILYVNHEVECGGAEHSLLDLLEGLDRERYEPHLVCSMEGPLTDRARALGAEIHLVPMLFQGKVNKFLGICRAALRIRKLIRSLGIQLVHTNSLIAGYCGIFAAKLCEVPTIWHVRDISYPPAARKVCTQATRVVANSHATAASLQFPPKHADHVEVVYNGVGPEFFAASAERSTDRADVREELHVSGGEKLVAVFARLDPWKGHADLLEAAKLVLHDAPETSFVIVGDTLFDGSRERHRSYRDELEQLARDRGIWGKVRFLGHRSDVVRLMNAMDVIVQPSAAPEPFGRSIAEAQAVGIPVIGSALGGIPELIEDGTTGLLFPAGDDRTLARQIGHILADPALADALATGGQNRARERFTRDSHVKGIQALYAAVQGT